MVLESSCWEVGRWLDDINDYVGNRIQTSHSGPGENASAPFWMWGACGARFPRLLTTCPKPGPKVQFLSTLIEKLIMDGIAWKVIQLFWVDSWLEELYLRQSRLPSTTPQFLPLLASSFLLFPNFGVLYSIPPAMIKSASHIPFPILFSWILLLFQFITN